MEVHVCRASWVKAEVHCALSVALIIDRSHLVEMCPVSGYWHNCLTEVEGELAEASLVGIGKIGLELISFSSSGIVELVMELLNVLGNVSDPGVVD